jgi:hypothetical protein
MIMPIIAMASMICGNSMHMRGGPVRGLARPATLDALSERFDLRVNGRAIYRPTVKAIDRCPTGSRLVTLRSGGRSAAWQYHFGRPAFDQIAENRSAYATDFNDHDA